MGQIDDVLPMTFFDAASVFFLLSRNFGYKQICLLFNVQIVFTNFQIFLNVLAIVAVIAFANPYLLIPAGVLFVVFFILLKYYMKTARSVKRLEGISK